jgi:hypothetical protein
MDYKSVYYKYKDQPIFKVVCVIWIVVCLIRIATWGFEFVHFLQVK